MNRITEDSLALRTQRFYERCNSEGESALVELPELFTDDLIFSCPVGTRYGLRAYLDFWKLTFTNRYKKFAFSDFESFEGNSKFALFYTMTIQMKWGAPSHTPTAAIFHTRGGKICEQIDYWDTAGGVAEMCPPLASGYRWTIGKLFAGGSAVAGTKGKHDPIL